METIIKIQGLSRQFGQTLALDNVDFQAGGGKVYGLVGTNGAGKTTLIKHVLGLLRAKLGSVSVFGLDPVRNRQQVLSRLGYLSETRDLPEWMTVQELLRYSSAFHPNWDQDYCDELVATFELDGSKTIRQLSRGMRAQVGLIAAVAHRPDLLLLDEPSSGLDAIVRNDILNAIVQTISDRGSTVLFSSHLLEEVERMSDHVTMIQNGRILLDGELDSLCESHRLCEFRFEQAQQQPPVLPVLQLRGEARSWRALTTSTDADFAAQLTALGGELLQSRRATLEEIFLARAGHTSKGQPA